jgi:hypothetical protein
MGLCALLVLTLLLVFAQSTTSMKTSRLGAVQARAAAALQLVRWRAFERRVLAPVPAVPVHFKMLGMGVNSPTGTRLGH